MAADSRLRALPLWESYEPVPMPGDGLLADGTDPRYQRCADAWDMMQAMTPYLAAMHPMNPDHIHEELELMGPNFGSYNYEWLSHSPRWRDHYYGEDQTYQYEYMRDALKLLTWQQRDTDTPTRWVLRCPQHLEQLPAHNKVFPYATVAITHRDPVSVIQSSITMLAYGQRMTRKKVLTDPLLTYWTDRIAHLLQACVTDRLKLPEGQLNSLDSLVNNAGASMPGGDEWTHQGLEESIRVNLFSAYHMSKACFELLKASELPGGASVIGIASLTFFFANELVPGYGAAKAGLVQLAKSLGLTWAEHGIRANNIAAGMTVSRMTRFMKDIPEYNDPILARTPLKRWGKPDDMAGAVLFLCSAQASFITGQTLTLDGGYTLGV